MRRATCYDCKGSGLAGDHECGGCAGAGVVERTPQRLAGQIGRLLVMKEWDGSVSAGMLKAAHLEEDLAVVEYVDGQSYRMGLRYLAGILI